MKKVVLIGLILIFLTAGKIYAFKVSGWKKLENNIYFETKTAAIEDGAKIGWFKNINNENYELIKIKAYCDTKAIEVKQTKLYDKNHNLLKDEINTHSIGCDYKGLINGEIYFKILCN